MLRVRWATTVLRFQDAACGDFLLVQQDSNHALAIKVTTGLDDYCLVFAEFGASTGQPMPRLWHENSFGREPMRRIDGEIYLSPISNDVEGILLFGGNSGQLGLWSESRIGIIFNSEEGKEWAFDLGTGRQLNGYPIQRIPAAKLTWQLGDEEIELHRFVNKDSL